MKNILPLLLIIILFSCKDKASEKQEVIESSENNELAISELTIVFASCNDQDMEQPLWKDIIESQPDVFIWGGDNIYADTEDMDTMAAQYYKIKMRPEYKELASKTKIIGTWDDHDYGKNDAGAEWEYKAEAQQLFLDFIDVPNDDVRRTREGVYHSEIYTTTKGSVKVIILDTRYFRGALKKSKKKGERYQPWKKGNGGTVLGDIQWEWLQKELNDENPTFTMIVSSIQFIANEHHWEKWGNFPDEVEKMNQMIANAKARNIFIVSGDRHLAEFSVKEIEGLSYPLVDFTTSGMTKTYPDSPEDVNQYRVGDQIRQLNFGFLVFDFNTERVKMEVRGEGNVIYEELEFED